MLTQDQVQALKAPFPPEALSADTSRGFELTSIKAAFIIERLNDVFGPCGIGWRYVHSPFEELATPDGRPEIVTEVALQYRCPATHDGAGCDPVVWSKQTRDWAFRSSTHDWSEPILACGGHALGKGAAPLTDARKSAVTDGLTKAASMIGVGHQVFKGQARAERSARPQSNGGNGHKGQPDATAFWTLYRSDGQAADVSLDVAKQLASQGDWAAACQELRALIAGS